MRLQYYFFKKYFLNPNLEQYFIERELKYQDRESIVPLFTEAKLPNYFQG